MANPRVQQLPPAFAVMLRPLQAFFALEAAGSILLLSSALLALVWANSPWAALYRQLLEMPIQLSLGAVAAQFSLHALINDGMMTVFFFVVGMEIKRELVEGELRTFRQAFLPLIAALGGMVIPAGIYLAFNFRGPTSVGWAIPMATDIAFAIGVLTLLRARVANSLIVFLTALAIFDDMGGILVIAIFYGSGIHVSWLLVVAGLVALLLVVNRFYVRSGMVYAALGAALWYALHHAGIHATLAGVALGLGIPTRPLREARDVLSELAAYVNSLLGAENRDRVDGIELLGIEEQIEDLEPPLQRFVHLLHPYVAFLIVPLFALANSGVSLEGVSFASLLEPLPLGIIGGLVVGKSLGIWGFTALAVRLGWGSMPNGSRSIQVFGAGLVGGIGFTVAIFVAQLAFAKTPHLLDQAKLGILVASLLAAVMGYVFLRTVSPRRALPTA